MTLTIDWEKKLRVPWSFFPGSGSAGCIMLREGRLLAGLHDASSFPEHQLFYASDDDGESWLQISSLENWSTTWSPRMCHWPDGIVCFASTDGNQKDFFVWRSINYGESWTKVKTFASGGTHANGPWVQSATTYQRSAGAMVGGPIVNNDGVVLSQIIYTEDKGQTWSDGGVIQPPGPESGLLAIQAKPGQNFLYGVRRDLTYNAHPLLTLDGGHTTPPGPSGGAGEVLAVAWLTDSDAVAGGFGQGGSDEHWPYLWWSDDGAQTWHHVAASDIAGWPTSGTNHPAVRNLHRITADAVALCLWNCDQGAPDPVIISTDKGHTYTITGTGWDISSSQGVGGQGQMVTTLGGQLIAVIERSPGESSGAEIWRGTLSC
jgi:hypothetical protein